jgi:hypothetical protein
LLVVIKILSEKLLHFDGGGGDGGCEHSEHGGMPEKTKVLALSIVCKVKLFFSGGKQTSRGRAAFLFKAHTNFSGISSVVLIHFPAISTAIHRRARTPHTPSSKSTDKIFLSLLNR